MENKEIKLPKESSGKTEEEINEMISKLETAAQERQQAVLSADSQYREIIGQMNGLQWTLDKE